MNRHHTPRETPRRPAFSLVLSLTVMAMLLLLCIGVAALMAVELRVAGAAVSKSRARLNALAGARISLGEVQRLLGPDQRVSATADILGDPAATDPQDAAYYRNSKYGTVVHPRWVGVWNSGCVDDGRSVSGAADGEKHKVIQRTTDGFLMDSRFGHARDWVNDRVSGTPATATKRMAGWLVSGNEGLSAGDPLSLTPFTPINRDKDVALVGRGTLGSLFVESADSDRLGARARKVSVSDFSGNSVGDYAYWVADEGVKTRINLRNKYEGMNPSSGDITAGGYFNFVISQRQRFDAVTPVMKEADDGGLLSKFSTWDSNSLASVFDFGALALIGGASDPGAGAKLTAAYFHDIGFYSAGVMCDVVNGGLQQDITAYLNHGEIQGLMGDSSPILSEGATSPGGSGRMNPRFGTIASWFRQASSSKSASSDAIPVSAGLPADGVAIVGENTATPGYSGTSAALVGQAPVVPVLTAYNLSYTATATDDSANQKARFLKYPYFSVWNPYSVPISLKQMTLTVNSNVNPSANYYDGSLIYSSWRKAVDYLARDVVLPPGQCVTYVPAGTPDVSGTPVGQKVSVNMTPGNPGLEAYYIDRGERYDSTDNAGNSVGQPVRYYWMLIHGDKNSDYKADSPMDQYALRADGGNGLVTLQQVNCDNFGYLKNNGWEFILENLSYRTDLPAMKDAKLSGPHLRIHHGFRMMALDDSDTTAGDGLPRNVNQNLFMNANVRAVVHGRHPLDLASVVRKESFIGRGIYTGDANFSLDDGELFAADASKTSPFLRNAGGNLSRFVLLDVPRKELGVQSLGQLQHAPLVQVSWAPTLAFGNALLPLTTSSPDTTGGALGGENALWGALQVKPFNLAIPQIRQHPEERSFLDWSYELNHALWDRCTVSGIPATNSGWGQPRWDLSLASQAAKNSRYVQAGELPGGGYFASPEFALYRAPYSLLRQGALNVNSTSVVAWQSLLSSFRGLILPTASGSAGGAALTPYCRHLFPQAGAFAGTGSAESNAYLPEVWAGVRVLSDAEIRTLAEKIVYEVKLRGPFLSLADFVNRRLKPAPGATTGGQAYSGWSEKEAEYLGTLQAAIEEAGLNHALTPVETSKPLGLDRSKADAAPGSTAPTTPIPLSHKAKAKLAGASSYLLQSDLLQQLGPSLSARSDTFTIRARGCTEDGAVACVELVVQRTPVPVHPGTIPVNPKSSAAEVAKGAQLFGRRFAVLAVKWFKEEEI